MITNHVFETYLFLLLESAEFQFIFGSKTKEKQDKFTEVMEQHLPEISSFGDEKVRKRNTWNEKKNDLLVEVRFFCDLIQIRQSFFLECDARL